MGRRKKVRLAAVVWLCATAIDASAQQDLSSRLSPTVPMRSATLNVSSGAVTTGATATSCLGEAVLYNNRCGADFYLRLMPGEVLHDNGQLPGSMNTEVPGCTDLLFADRFQFAYCTDQSSVFPVLTFRTLHASCTDVTGIPGQGFVLPALPGSSSGLACWTLTVDLAGTSLLLSFASDGDGVYDGDRTTDTFGVSMEMQGLTGNTGFVVSGDPVYVGTGCDFAVGTTYEISDPTGAAPMGTGYGSRDRFGVSDGGPFAGCFFFGGWPTRPWAGFWLRMTSPSDACEAMVAAPVCFGDGSVAPCPCGNESPLGTPAGCAHSGGKGARMCLAPGSGGSIAQASLQLFVTDLPVGNGGLFLVSTGLAPPLAAFDGLACVGGGLRLGAGAQTAPGERLSGDDGPLGPSLITEAVQVSPTFFVPGLYYFQYWTRDVGGGSPCGAAANFSVALRVGLGP